MNKKVERKPGGDKLITLLRDIGDVLEGTVIGLLTIASIVEVAVIGVRLSTDLRIQYNKQKMKKGGNL